MSSIMINNRGYSDSYMRYRQARMAELQRKETGNSLFCNDPSRQCLDPPNYYCEECNKRMCERHFSSIRARQLDRIEEGITDSSSESSFK